MPSFLTSGCALILSFAATSTFAQDCVLAAIFDPATSSISVYNPLVINRGSKVGTDLTAPVPATVPKWATVGIWFGTNAATLTLAGSTKGYVNGLGDSIFEQATCSLPTNLACCKLAVNSSPTATEMSS